MTGSSLFRCDGFAWRTFLKRGVLIGVVGLLAAAPGWALPRLEDVTSKAKVELQYPSMELSNPLSRGIQQVTGLNALVSWLGSKMMEKELEKQLRGDIKCAIQSYSALDLMSGKAKQVSLHGEHLLYKKFIPFTELDVTTVEETPLYVLVQKKPAMIRPVRAEIRAVLTEADLNHVFQTKRGMKQLRNIALNLPPFGEQRIDFLEPKIDLDQDMLVFSAKMNLTGAPVENALPFTARARVTTDRKHQALQLKDLAVQAEGIDDLSPLAGFVESYFGKIVKLSRLKVKGHWVDVQLDEPTLGDERLVLHGFVTLSPIPQAIKQVTHH
jgi:hypothetical protein